MTTQTSSQLAPARREGKDALRRILQVDAVVEAALGIVFVLAAAPLSRIFGVQQPWTLMLLGMLLLAASAWLLYQATRPDVSKGVVKLVAFLNLDWTVLTALVLFMGWLPLTLTGTIFFGVVADVTLVLGILQLYLVRRDSGAA